MLGVRLATVLCLGVIAVAATVALLHRTSVAGTSRAAASVAHARGARGGHRAATTPIPARPSPVAGSASTGPITASDDPSSAARNDDAAITAELRRLGWTNPELTLELARLGNEQHPDSRDAPERAWFEARALTNLGRFDEARTAARAMLARYPESAWTQDVRRHLLSHPFGLPPRPRRAETR